MTNFRDDPFFYPEVVFAKTTSANVPTSGFLKSGIAPLDGRALYKGALCIVPFGLVRLPRQNQQGLAAFAGGHNQYPVLLGHTFNREPTGPTQTPVYGDPMPGPFQMIDDLLVYHDETKAYLLFRNLWSAVNDGPGVSGGDDAPGSVTLSLASGITLVLEDYPNGSRPTAPVENPVPAPPPPVRGKVSLTMPSTASLVVDEPTVGQCTFTFTHPTGATFAIDANGNINVQAASGKKVTVIADDAEIGADSGAADGHKIGLKLDFTALKTYIDNHTHTGVQTGSGTSGTPSSASPSPTCASKSFAT